MIRIRIRSHELGLLFRNGDFERVLQPGAYFMPLRKLLGQRVEVYDKLDIRFVHDLLDEILTVEDLRDQLLLVEVFDDQAALLWKDGRLESMLPPGKHAFWKGPYELRAEVLEASAQRFEHPQLEAILARPEAAKFLQAVHIDPGEEVLFYREGRLIERADSGLCAFWRQVSNVTWESVGRREQVADVSGQEIMTADKLTLRVNLLVTYEVQDALQAVTAVDDYKQALYRQAQLALRAEVGALQLDELLSDRESIGNALLDAIAKPCAEFGVVVKSVGLRDLILPGDMKSILNQVIEAQKQAEANLIRRREETAAARSQANTARLLAENPALARMKELEALREILAGTKATFVFGQHDLLRQVSDLTKEAGELAED